MGNKKNKRKKLLPSQSIETTNKKIKKQIILTLEVRICQMKIEKGKKNIWKIVTIKDFSNHILNRIEQ